MLLCIYDAQLLKWFEITQITYYVVNNLVLLYFLISVSIDLICRNWFWMNTRTNLKQMNTFNSSIYKISKCREPN